MIVMVILAIGPLGWANAQQGFGGMVRYHKDCLPGISSFSCQVLVVSGGLSVKMPCFEGLGGCSNQLSQLGFRFGLPPFLGWM